MSEQHPRKQSDEEGDILAEACAVVDDTTFERDVNKPVELIASYEKENQGKRITPALLQTAMNQAGYAHMDLVQLEETIKTYYGEV